MRSLGRVLPLYFVVFIGFVGYSLMITAFTPLLLGDGGGLVGASSSTSTRTLVLGGLLALYPLAQFFGAPVLGSLSDRFGRRPVLLASLAASAAFYALMALALHLHSLALLAVACLLAGLAEANIAIAQSAIADIAPTAERSRLFGYVYLSSSLAYVVGPLAGGKLADPGVVAWFGPPTPFLAAAILLIATLALTAGTFRETHAPDPGAPLGLGLAVRNVGAAFARGGLRSIFAANFALYLAIFGFFRVYPMYLVDHFGMGISRESEFIAWVAVPIVLANLFLVGWLSRRMSPRRLTVRCGAALAVCLSVGGDRPPPGRRLLGHPLRLRAGAGDLPALDGSDRLRRGRPDRARTGARHQPVAAGRRRGALGTRGRRPRGDLDRAGTAGDGRAGAARSGLLACPAAREAATPVAGCDAAPGAFAVSRK